MFALAYRNSRTSLDLTSKFSTLPAITLATTLALGLCACPGVDGMVPDDPPNPQPDPVSDYLDLPETPHNYANVELPGHFQTTFVSAFDNSPAANPTTDAGATLGRVLFYDTQLSQNNTIACASCHVQEYGFTDPEQFSEGFEGGFTGRNSMGLANSRFYANGRFFWDERAETLEDQVLMPIQDQVEMGMTLEALVERVAEQPYYPYLFAEAFGDEEVTSERISQALAQFVRSIVSYQSRFDEGLAMVNAFIEPFPNFTDEENRGKQLFFSPEGNCAVCHVANPPPMPGAPPPNQAIFFIGEALNNGLDADFNVADNGLGDLTGRPEDNGLFKSSSLRNIALTAPYMHDGRFETLREVVEFYNSEVADHPNLDMRLRARPPAPPMPQRLNLNDADIDALVAFLDTLTDFELIEDERLSNPFLDSSSAP